MWIPYHKITLLTAVSSEMELWSSGPILLPLCWNMGVCLCNSCVLYHSQQAVIFPNREIIALQAAKGTQVCQAWMGWACPALWYSICCVLHGLCVLLCPQSKPLQGEEGHRAAKLECSTLAFGERCHCVVPSSPQLKWLYIRSVNHGRSHRGCQSLYGNRCSMLDAVKLFLDAQTLVTDAQRFSQYPWPSLVPLMPVLLQPWVPSPAVFEKLSSNSSQSCRAGPRALWAPEGFCCASTGQSSGWVQCLCRKVCALLPTS